VIDRVLELSRALSGAPEEPARGRVAALGASPPRMARGFVRGAERIKVSSPWVRIQTIGAVVIAAVSACAATYALRAIPALAEAPPLESSYLPLIGALLALAGIPAVRWATRRAALRNGAIIAFELLREGATPAATVAVAEYAAGRRLPALRDAVARDPKEAPGAAVIGLTAPPHPPGRLLELALERAPVVGGIWVFVSFYILYSRLFAAVAELEVLP